jgi:PRTRC genetic system ThiF family protein
MAYDNVAQKFYIDATHINFVVVGAGGTGGYLIPSLARFCSLDKKSCTILVIDGDTVEERNIIRQNFIKPDIGRNKAEVMATRYSKAFGIRMEYMPYFIGKSSSLSLEQVLLPRTSSTYDNAKVVCVIIGCVDNNATRVMIDQNVKAIGSDNYPLLYIDSGNEEYHGQVVLGASVGRHMESRPIEHIPYTFSLPTICQRYPSIMEAKEQTKKVSCAERAIADPQTAQANMMAANIIMSVIYQIFDITKGLSYSEIRFNTSTCTMLPIYNTPKVMHEIGMNVVPSSISQNDVDVTKQVMAANEELVKLAHSGDRNAARMLNVLCKAVIGVEREQWTS